MADIWIKLFAIRVFEYKGNLQIFHISYFGATGNPFLDFWWRLLSVSNILYVPWDPYLVLYIANLSAVSTVGQQFKMHGWWYHITLAPTKPARFVEMLHRTTLLTDVLKVTLIEWESRMISAGFSASSLASYSAGSLMQHSDWLSGQDPSSDSSRSYEFPNFITFGWNRRSEYSDVLKIFQNLSVFRTSFCKCTYRTVIGRSCIYNPRVQGSCD